MTKSLARRKRGQKYHHTQDEEKKRSKNEVQFYDVWRGTIIKLDCIVQYNIAHKQEEANEKHYDSTPIPDI